MLSEGGSGAVARYLKVETAIGTLVNMVLAGLFTTLMFGSGEITLWGPGGLALDFLPATFLPVFAMTAGLTWATRKRRSAGKAPLIPATALALPSNPLLRGALFGLAATLMLGGIGLMCLIAFWSPDLPFATLLAFKVAYGALVGLSVTPLILIAALRDPLSA